MSVISTNVGEGLGHSGMVDINLIGWTKILLELNAQKYLDQLSKTSGLTNNEIEWGWSTCAHYCGVFSGTNHIINKEKFRNFISPIPSYWEIGNTPFERQFKYRKFLSEPQPQMVVKEIIRCMSRGLPWLKSDTKTPNNVGTIEKLFIQFKA